MGDKPALFVLYCLTQFLWGRGTTTLLRFMRFPSKEVTNHVAMAPAASEAHAGCWVLFMGYLVFLLRWILIDAVLP